MVESSGKFKDTDFTISDIHGIIASKTDDYVCVYTGLAFDNPEYNVEFGTRQPSSLKRHISFIHEVPANGTNQTIPIFRQFFGGWFWELFVCMVVMLPFLIIGTYAIDSIQTPVFEAKKKN